MKKKNFKKSFEFFLSVSKLAPFTHLHPYVPANSTHKFLKLIDAFYVKKFEQRPQLIKSHPVLFRSQQSEIPRFDNKRELIKPDRKFPCFFFLTSVLISCDKPGFNFWCKRRVKVVILIRDVGCQHLDFFYLLYPSIRLLLNLFKRVIISWVMFTV